MDKQEQTVVRRVVGRIGSTGRKVGNWSIRYGWWFTGPLMYSAFLFGVVVTERVYMNGKNKGQLRSK